MAPQEKNTPTLTTTPTLRICCYGSSSQQTQERYTNDAYNLGQLLRNRGHTCVNGAGRYGCMGALNKGVEEAKGDGKVFGVIHEMFLSKGGEGDGEGDGDGDGKVNNNWLESCAPVFTNYENAEIYIAGGDDLQERKKKLVEGADALIVMPGGTGTFDELWEMACSKQIGLIDTPIVCINIDGYYDSFHSMLQRAHEDGFLYKHPDDILHFKPDYQTALDWIERVIIVKSKEQQQQAVEEETKDEKRPIVRRQSFYQRMMSTFNMDTTDEDVLTQGYSSKDNSFNYIIMFSTGLALGMMTSFKR